ncbi:MAG: protein-L-isoaspartate(D-aspartate) O-methyltransferase [Bacteroidales bacterium]|nr:protein-L-isoaspartate(D-aspartate) O-methyltransferase [Bacteroidales bacterium]
MKETTPIDTFRHVGLRQKMCANLQKNGITDQRVLNAMQSVPRHWFIDTMLDNQAYQDRAINIDCDQTISRPSTVAKQSQLLDTAEGMQVLEIGTGSGYQAAVLYRMGLKVFSIERQKQLFEQTRRRLNDWGFRVKCFLGDGYQGLTEGDYGLFDRIIITCGASEVPHTLMGQLKIGGRMVIPVGNEGQQMLRITKHGDEQEQWEIEEFGQYNFVPMLKGRNFN